jgi:hypothetical protein
MGREAWQDGKQRRSGIVRSQTRCISLLCVRHLSGCSSGNSARMSSHDNCALQGRCVNPGADANGAWCLYEPGSCDANLGGLSVRPLTCGR